MMGVKWFSGDCECICWDLSLLGCFSWVVHRAVKKRPWFTAFTLPLYSTFPALPNALLQSADLDCWSHVESYQTYLCLWSFYREQSCFPWKEYLFSVGEMLSFNMKSFIYCASNLLLLCMAFLEAHVVRKVSTIQMWFGMTWELHCFAIIIF